MENNFRNVVRRWKIYKSIKAVSMHFCARSNNFRDINVANVLPSESRAQSTNVAMTSFDGKCQNLQIFDKTDTHIHHRNGQGHGYRRNRRYA